MDNVGSSPWTMEACSSLGFFHRCENEILSEQPLKLLYVVAIGADSLMK